MVADTVKPRHEQQGPRKVLMHLSPELVARIQQYQRDGGLNSTVQDMARALIQAALDYPEVHTSLVRSAQQQAFLTVKRGLQNAMRDMVGSLEKVAMTLGDGAEHEGGDGEFREAGSQ